MAQQKGGREKGCYANYLAVIGYGERQRTIDCAHGVSEIDAVHLQIDHGLLRIPFTVHGRQRMHRRAPPSIGYGKGRKEAGLSGVRADQVVDHLQHPALLGVGQLCELSQAAHEATGWGIFFLWERCQDEPHFR